MTPREYIRQIERLVASGDDRGALAFSAQHHQTVVPSLTDAELLHVGGLLEGASMALDLADGEVHEATNGAAVPARVAKVRDTAGAR
jgi:hypothetical protein